MTDNVEHLNPFDPAALRLDQSFTESAGVKKLITTIGAEGCSSIPT